MFAAKEWCDAARRNADISDRHVERMRANYEEWQRRKSKLYEVRELDAYFSPDEALRAVISQLYVRKNIWEDIARDYQQILKQCPEHPFHDDMLRAIEEMQQMIQEIGSAGEFIGPPIPRDYHPGGETNDVSSKEGFFGAEEYFW